MRKVFLSVIIIILSAASASCFEGMPGDSVSRRLAFDFGLRFEYLFDNAEYARSNDYFDHSGTLHGFRLAPSAGIVIPQGDRLEHRVRLGIDLLKYAGSQLPVKDVLSEVTLYYDIEAVLAGGGRFEALAGCFPRSEFLGDYLGPAFDRTALFSDANVDGMLFKYRGRSFSAELGLDWLGMYGDAAHPERRERFQILSSGDWGFAGPFHLVWTGLFYHFAESPAAHGVVDNHMFNPMIEWRPSCWFDRMSVSAGGILTYQWDRAYESSARFPAGFYSCQHLEKCHAGIHNRFYLGENLQPLFSKYGTDLYPGQPMFRTEGNGCPFADELTAFYTPVIVEWLEAAVALTFSFGSPCEVSGVYRGCRQTVMLRINLERFPRLVPGRKIGRI